MNGFCGGFPSGNSCGGILGGMSPMLLIIIFLLFTQGGDSGCGCGGNNGCGGSSGCGGLFGGDSSIFIILILFCCMGGGLGGNCGVCEGK